MNHDFNIERAKAGEPIQFCKTGGAWVDVHFVGMTGFCGPNAVVQFSDGTLLQTQALRMKPMPTKKWVLEFDSFTDAEAALDILHRGSSSRLWPETREVEYPPTE